ncbi:hypothetical protein AM232_10230 [Bacillus sp. FJAT-21352]|nr:hypothetical protein AM232_10230 [Bacillus sp. FJAT-21352]
MNVDFPLQALASRGRLWGLPWTLFSRRSLVPSVPINWNISLKTVGWTQFEHLNKLVTLLLNNWLAKNKKT